MVVKSFADIKNVMNGKRMQHEVFNYAQVFIMHSMVLVYYQSQSYITEVTHLPHQYIQGTAICAVIPSILTSTISRMDLIPLKISSWFGLGALLGDYVDVEIALNLSMEHFRKLYMSCLDLFRARSHNGAFCNIQNIFKKYIYNLTSLVN